MRPTGGRSHEDLRLCQAGDDHRSGRGGVGAGRRLSGGRHQPARPDEGRRQPARAAWSMSRHLPGLDRYRATCPTAACASARSSATPTSRTIAAFARRFPAVAEALLSGASAQLRNAATVGGNLLQRTRCAISMTSQAPATSASPGRLRRARRREPAARRARLERALHRDASVRFLRAAGRARRRRRDRRQGGRREIPLETLSPSARRHARARERARAGRADRRRAPAGRGGRAFAAHARY